MSWFRRDGNNNKTTTGIYQSIKSDEYETLFKRFTELFARVEELQTKIKILETNFDNLRGNFNRKLSGIKKEETEEQEKSINNPVILPYDGHFR